MDNQTSLKSGGAAINSLRYWQTAGYYAAFVILGLTTASFGPALPYIAQQTHTQLALVSSLLALRSLGYLLGSFRGGRLYDQRSGHPVVMVVLLVLAGTLSLIPAIPYLVPMAVILLIVGLAEGSLDVGGNTLIMWAHGSRVGPFMNGLHFFFGVGAFLAPILIALAISATGSYGAAYWIIGFLILPVAFAFSRIASPTRTDTLPGSEEKSYSQKLVILLVAFFFLYVGAEVSFGTWAFTYATRLNLADEATAAYITSAFWGALTLGRLLGVPITAKLRPKTVLWIDLAGCLAGISIIVAQPYSNIAFWIGAIVLGLSMASIFPTTLSLAENRLQISGKITGWFFVGASLGGLVVAWVIGQLIEPVGPPVAMWIILGDILAAITLFGFIK
jgi:FHS family Na+ dependent glucose MFS transporter 1